MTETGQKSDMRHEPDNTDEILAEFRQRRQSFDQICVRLWDNYSKPYQAFNRCTCPACGYPTIGARSQYDMCRLCCWEDDGQDDEKADEVWGGPNGDYSLTEARLNFSRFSCMFRPEDTSDTEWATSDLVTNNKLRRIYSSLLHITDNNKIAERITEIKKLEGSPTTLEEYLARMPLSYDQRKGNFLGDQWLPHPVWREISTRYRGLATRDSALSNFLHRFTGMKEVCQRLKEKKPGLFDRSPCPSCGFPTMTTDDDRCLLCDWRQPNNFTRKKKMVDGDDFLTEARVNFEKYLTIYCPDDEAIFSRGQANILMKCILICTYHDLFDARFQDEKVIKEILTLENQISPRESALPE
ncbi:MAG: CPCC family cysteine-rich protein [Thermodesulfobacteriota bacterium]